MAKITVTENGPYEVSGAQIVRGRIVKGETGHSETLELYETLDDGAGDSAWLCRCGHSQNKPFCDGSHKTAFDGKGFDGTEAAPTDTYAERAEVLGGEGIEVSDERAICVHAGFCSARRFNVWKAVPDTGDTEVRERVVQMVEACPSGALTHRPAPGAADDEPALPSRVVVMADGPLFVTGDVEVTRADGEPFESRPRMTLCRCGVSSLKPLCDAAHEDAEFRDD